MNLTVNKLSALRILRAIRSSGRRLPGRRCDLAPPSPEPHRYWTVRSLPLERLALDRPPDRGRLQVAAPSKSARPRASFFSCTVYSGGLPPGSFISLGGGLAIPSPELLFVELACVMSPAVHVLLGYELCGSFSRSPERPREGAVRLGVRPVTTPERMGALLDGCSNVRGSDAARRSLQWVSAGAWSATEALLSTLLALPPEELGYGLGRPRLNVRHESPPELRALGCSGSRVPDIEIPGTCVGLNYDGHEHLDLTAIERAVAAGAIEEALRSIREKYVDDLRRNRELAASGHVVLPVVAEDLFQGGGLDAVVLEAVLAAEAIDGARFDATRGAIASRRLSRARQELIWSLLPWGAAGRYGRDLMARERAATSGGTVTDELFEL